MAQVTEHPGDLWEALASGANRALFLLFFVSLLPGHKGLLGDISDL
jgi:hypothetical protein